MGESQADAALIFGLTCELFAVETEVNDHSAEDRPRLRREMDDLILRRWPELREQGALEPLPG